MDESRVNPNGQDNGAKEYSDKWAAFELRVQDGFSYRVPSRGLDFQALESQIGSLSLLEPTVQHQQPLRDNRWSYLSSSIHDEGINGGGGRCLFPLSCGVESNQSQRSSFQNRLVNGRTFGYNATTLTNGFLNGNSTRNRLHNQSPRISNNGSGVNDPWRSKNCNPMVLRAKDRVFSQLLQNQIVKGSKEMVDMIFDELIFDICELMVDPFGNLVLQTLMEKCNSEQISQILDMVTQQQFALIPICTDPIGARVVQSLLWCLRSEEQALRIVEAVSIVALVLTRSTNAKHVILQCFSQFPPSLNRNLIEMIVRNCYRIAIDQHGCCLLQQCLSCGCHELKRRLIVEIIQNVLILCLDCYGNYVVQYVVELNHPNVTQDIINMLRGNYGYLSRNKYGSHAVQKLLQNRFIDSRLIIKDLLEDIDALVIDQYGNYVIQTAWFASQGYIRNQLLWHIKKNLQYIKYNKFGIILLKKIGLWSNMLK